MIITIDGPAGAGKSTVARELARRLEFEFLDTGAMYRAIALAALENGIDPNHSGQVIEIARPLKIFLKGEKTFLGNRDVSQTIRSPKVSEASSQVAEIPQIRDILVALQRQIAATGNFVCEGRDQGSVVFPDAEFKFFITATTENRACRRHKELAQFDRELTLEQVIADQEIRDHRDSNRLVGALAPEPDAIEIHTDDLSVEQVIENMLAIIRRRIDSKT